MRAVKNAFFALFLVELVLACGTSTTPPRQGSLRNPEQSIPPAMGDQDSEEEGQEDAPSGDDVTDEASEAPDAVADAPDGGPVEGGAGGSEDGSSDADLPDAAD